MRIKDIQCHKIVLGQFNNMDQLKSKQPIADQLQAQRQMFHDQFTEMLDSLLMAINGTDYEHMWESRKDYWMHNWGKPDTPAEIQRQQLIKITIIPVLPKMINKTTQKVIKRV